MAENYVEYEILANYLDLDAREKELDEFLVNSSNEYIRNQLFTTDFEETTPYNIREAAMIVFEDKKAFHASQNNNSDDKTAYKMSEEIRNRIQDLISLYTVKNI